MSSAKCRPFFQPTMCFPLQEWRGYSGFLLLPTPGWCFNIYFVSATLPRASLYSYFIVSWTLAYAAVGWSSVVARSAGSGLRSGKQGKDPWEVSYVWQIRYKWSNATHQGSWGWQRRDVGRHENTNLATVFVTESQKLHRKWVSSFNPSSCPSCKM